MNKRQYVKGYLFLKTKWFLLISATVGTLLVISWPLSYSSYGIDFTDEGFYLNWISNPFAHDISLTQFGFFYHPLYIALGGSIPALRQANILITFILGWGLCYTLLRCLSSTQSSNQLERHVISAGIATSTLILFDTWLITPSYNSLVLQALLITSIGLLLAETNCTHKSVLGWLVLSVGGWLAFMAKPSTAAVLTAIVLVYLLISGKLKFRFLFIAIGVTTALFYISSLIIDGSATEFITRIKLGFQHAQILGGGRTLDLILRADPVIISTDLKQSIAIISLMCYLGCFGAQSTKTILRTISILCAATFFCTTVLIISDATRLYQYLGQFQALLTSSLCIAGAFLYVTAALQQGQKYLPSRLHLAIATLFILMPYAYVSGTSNNYWLVGGSASFFWIIAGLVFLEPLARIRGSWTCALPLVLAVQAITVTLLQKGFDEPYRQQQPLQFNTDTADFGRSGSTLVLSESYSRYVSEAVRQTKDAGYAPNTPMIDLTGQSPGILYALGAESLGQAWIIGGYPGSADLAVASLLPEPCAKISKAWLLYEPDGPRSISPLIMTNVGAKFPEDYELRASWKTAAGAGGYQAERTQVLYQPVEPERIFANCESLRKEITN